MGHYLVERLLENADNRLFLVLRAPERLDKALRTHARVTIIEADVRETGEISEAIDEVDVAILAATAWGGGDTHEVIVSANVALMKMLSKKSCQRVLYFSTASILERGGKLLEAAREHGTEYIKSKQILVTEAEGIDVPFRLIGLFPTLILGGCAEKSKKPLSHFANLLKEAKKWVWLGRFFSIHGRMHIVHAAEIAEIVVYLCNAEFKPEYRRIVLGNPAQTIDAWLNKLCMHVGKHHIAFIKVTPAIAEFIIKLFRIELSPWDRYCMLNPDQSYLEARDASSFGLEFNPPEFSKTLTEAGIAGRN